MTYLNLVNNVLRRLREEEVSSVQDSTYAKMVGDFVNDAKRCLLYTSPSPRDGLLSRMPSSA